MKKFTLILGVCFLCFGLAAQAQTKDAAQEKSPAATETAKPAEKSAPAVATVTMSEAEQAAHRAQQAAEETARKQTAEKTATQEKQRQEAATREQTRQIALEAAQKRKAAWQARCKLQPVMSDVEIATCKEVWRHPTPPRHWKGSY